LAIVQISQITHRKGLEADLPQPLASAELGWSTDTRQLWIGNGTLTEGAPVVGNTEILTEFSDILQLSASYTYKGEAAGYTVQTGPTPGTPVAQSLQSWFDQFATVTDFGAVGDGVTDDTDAINWALNQLYCIEVNPQIRRSLFFPAGVYRITGTILIPPYATLYGEGSNNSIIQHANVDDSTLNVYVARTADSLQQYGVNIGNNGALAPTYITISNMGFESLDQDSDIFLVEDASYCRFQNVGFIGPLTQAELVTDSNPTAGVRFASTASLVCNQIVFDGCEFEGATYAINTDQQLRGVTVSNSEFETLYKGVVLGEGAVVDGGPTGFRITSSVFDKIYAEGIIFGDVSLNASGYNTFYDVGNHFDGTLNPHTSIIDIQNNNNVSIGDMFERTTAYATAYPRINLNDTLSIATTNGEFLSIGTYNRASGQRSTLGNNTTGTIFTTSSDLVKTFMIDYSITRDVTYRTGTIMVAVAGGVNVLQFDDTNYVENASTGITLSVSQASTTVSLTYSSTNTGVDGTISYSIRSLT
jgi:hypothetical protein